MDHQDDRPQFEQLRDFFGDLVDALEDSEPNLAPLEKAYAAILNITRDKAQFFIRQVLLYRKMERAKQAYFDGMGDAKLWVDRMNARSPRPAA